MENDSDVADDSEFSYIPLIISQSATVNPMTTVATAAALAMTEVEVMKAVVANDGSFLAKTMTHLEQKEKAAVDSNPAK